MSNDLYHIFLGLRGPVFHERERFCSYTNRDMETRMGWLNRFLGNDDIRQVFILDGKRLSPIEYGNTAVLLAADISVSTIKQIIDLSNNRDFNNNIYTQIKEQPKIAQIQLIALNSAAFIVKAIYLPQMTADAIRDAQKGISESFVKSKFGPVIGNAMDGLSKTYGKMLFDEIKTPTQDMGSIMDFGILTNTVYESIKDGYSAANNSFIDVDYSDEIQIQLSIKSSIAVTMKKLSESQLQFIA